MGLQSWPIDGFNPDPAIERGPGAWGLMKIKAQRRFRSANGAW